MAKRTPASKGYLTIAETVFVCEGDGRGRKSRQPDPQYMELEIDHDDTAHLTLMPGKMETAKLSKSL